MTNLEISHFVAKPARRRGFRPASIIAAALFSIVLAPTSAPAADTNPFI